MNVTYFSAAITTSSATPEQIWEALTNPEKAKQFMFGTTVSTDWKAGSSITYKGEWEGKAYEDKGEIKECLPGQRLVVALFSPLSGKEDKPENYHLVSYMLSPAENGTDLAIYQDNAETKESSDRSSTNWKMMLDSLTKLVEA